METEVWTVCIFDTNKIQLTYAPYKQDNTCQYQAAGQKEGENAIKPLFGTRSLYALSLCDAYSKEEACKLGVAFVSF